MKQMKIENTPLRNSILRYAMRAWERRGTQEQVLFNVLASQLADYEGAGGSAGVIIASSVTWPGVNPPLPAWHIEFGREAFWALKNGTLVAKVHDTREDLTL